MERVNARGWTARRCRHPVLGVCRLQGEIVGRYNANTVDRVAVAAVERQIERYEQESGVGVTKVAFYTEQRFEYQEYAFSARWSDAQAFEVLDKLLVDGKPFREMLKYIDKREDAKTACSRRPPLGGFSLSKKHLFPLHGGKRRD